MRAAEIITERRSNPEVNVKVPLSQQIDAIIKKHGGTIDDYWVSSTQLDKLGFYGGDSTYYRPEITRPGKAPVVPMKPFHAQRKFHSPEYATYAVPIENQPQNAEQKYGLWFMPLKAAFQSLNNATYPYLRNFVFLVKLNDDAWLQPVSLLQKTRTNLIGIRPSTGKHKVGQYNSDSQIAVFFEPAYKIVGKWTKQEILNNARREQIGGIDAQRRVGQERAAAKNQLKQDLEDLF